MLIIMMVALLCAGIVACSESDDLEEGGRNGNGMDGSTLKVKLSSAGTLSSYINDSTMYKITRLKVSGEINGTDIWLLRQMAGCDEEGETTRGVLGYLDLSDARIVSGGRRYYKYCTTKDDMLPDCMFNRCQALTSLSLPKCNGETAPHVYDYYYGVCYSCTGLTSVKLPDGLKSVPAQSFRGCGSLTSCEIPNSVVSIGMYAFGGCI